MWSERGFDAFFVSQRVHSPLGAQGPTLLHAATRVTSFPTFLPFSSSPHSHLPPSSKFRPTEAPTACMSSMAHYSASEEGGDNANDDVRLDLGIGPSTPAPTIHASIRVRPVTIRFTEPGVKDLSLQLHSITSFRPARPPSSNQPASTPATQEQQLIFDFDTEQTAPSAASTHTQNDDTATSIRHILSSFSESGLLGDASVRQLKHRMGVNREGVKDRRLRLIHAGRVLRDGVRLVGYLEELDARQRVQARQTLRHQLAALDEDDASGSDDERGRGEGEEEEEEEQDRVEKRQMRVRELVEWLHTFGRENEQGDHHSSVDELIAENSKGKGKGKGREPSWYDDVVRVVIRTAPKVYLQCSVGEVETSPPPPTHDGAPAKSLIDASDPPPPHDVTQADVLDEDAAEGEAERNRGFNRLLEAGLSPAEVASIRDQFRSSHPLNTPYDLIRSREHAQHLLEMEESWMDSFASTSNNPPPNLTPDSATEGQTPSGAYSTVLQGLMVGFFLPPLIPLFCFRDKPHPSSLPASMSAAETDGEGGEDEEEEWERERTQLTRESVFGSTMQISILFGLTAK